MVDEIYDRHYQEGRAALHNGLDRLFNRAAREIGKTFEAIHRFQWSAPWNRVTNSRQRSCG